MCTVSERLFLGSLSHEVLEAYSTPHPSARAGAWKLLEKRWFQSIQQKVSQPFFIARDVVKNLNDRRVLSTADFNWLSQLRYYCYDEVVHVCMITTDLEFGYEYLGNTPRLVITPLTDRCYR